MRPSPSAAPVLTLLAACLLGGCSLFRSGTPDNEPTIKTLAKRSVTVEKEQGVAANSDERAIEAYRKFLALAPRAPQSTGALRRIGDLEMETADHKSANGEVSEPDYRVAIARYEEFLKAYPNDPSNDRVLYQLARAYEESGNLEVALKTLNRLVKDYPATNYKDEAQFRRGELLFTAKDYVGSEKAYEIALNAGPGSPYPRSRALHARLVAVQARPARRRLGLVLRRARRQGRRPTTATAASIRCKASRGPTANWSRTRSASRASASPTFRAQPRSPRSRRRRRAGPTSTASTISSATST